VRASPLVSQRWLIAGALFAVVFSASSPIAAFGVFLPVLAEHFGWSRGAISVALSTALMLGGLNAFVVGAIADRYGPRFILTFTVAMAGAGFTLASTIDSLWELYLFIGIMAASARRASTSSPRPPSRAGSIVNGASSWPSCCRAST